MEEARIETLDNDACLAHLRAEPIGRLAVLVDGAPIVLPVTYRLVETSGVTWVAIRTRPGNVMDQAGTNVAFEIDGIDPTRRRGWSVLVRGTLQHVDPDAAGFRERFDTQPWLATERDSWLVIEPSVITGRELHPAEPDWAFTVDAYL